MQLMENSRQLTKKGPWDFFIYDDNITVDGLQGHNTTEIHLEKTGDAMAPTLVQLVARDKENNIRNIYDNASEGKITFSAGAFAYNFEDSKQGYLYTPLSELTVEYSGYRSGNWKKLEVSEISGKFFMPGYGAYYEAPLDQIEGGGQNGWFDLHFKLVDPTATCRPRPSRRPSASNRSRQSKVSGLTMAPMPQSAPSTIFRACACKAPLPLRVRSS